MALTAIGLVLLLAPALAAAQFGFITQWGSEGSGNGQFSLPWSIAIDPAGDVYVADLANDRIQKFDNGGGYIRKWGGPLDFAGEEGDFYSPSGVATDAAGNVYVADGNHNRVQKFNSDGAFIAAWGWGVSDGSAMLQVCTSGCQSGIHPAPGEEASGNGQFDGPKAVATDSSGNVYVVDFGNRRVQKFNPSGAYLGKWGSFGAGPGQFVHPTGIAVDSADNVYVSESDLTPGGQDRVQKFTSSGALITSWTSRLGDPKAVETDAAGRVYVAEPNERRIQVFSPSGAFRSTIGHFGSGPGQFDVPYDLAFDAAGDLFVIEGTTNHRVQKLGPSGSAVVSTLSADQQGAKKMRLKLGCPLEDCTAKIKGKGKVPRSGRRNQSASASAKTKKFALAKQTLRLSSGPSKRVRIKFKKNKQTVKAIAALMKSSKSARRGSKVTITVKATTADGDVAKASERFGLKP